MRKESGIWEEAKMEISAIEYLGLARVCKRGTGEILADQAHALLIRDTVSGAYLLACEDNTAGLALLDRFVDSNCRLLMVSNAELGLIAFEKYGFAEKLVCYQVAYYGEKPSIDPAFSIRTAEKADYPMLLESYHLVSPEKLFRLVRQKSILLGYSDGHLVGFIGEHLEGSMGLLYVFPEYRRKGFGTALQTALIAKTMEKGDLPFGQVETSNQRSLNLQKKLGMQQSEHLIVWMWK